MCVLQEAVRGAVGGPVPPRLLPGGLLPLPSLRGGGGRWDTHGGRALRPPQHQSPHEHDGTLVIIVFIC